MTAALGAVQTALWGIITFSILVVLHEMGHFLAARAFGVKVHEFMVGLPGPSLRLHTKNMDWGVTAIPLGGYVRIAGMEPGEEDELLGSALAMVRDAGPTDARALATELRVSDERAEAILTSLLEWKAVALDADGRYRLSVDGEVADLEPSGLLDRARSFTYRGQSTTKRITILAMGVVTNLVVAILTLTVVLSVWGYLELSTQVDSVEPGAPAAEAGIALGDTLLAVDGEKFDSWELFQSIMARTEPGQTVTITIERADDLIYVPVTLAEKDGHGFLGVGPAAVQVRPNIIESVGYSLRYTGLLVRTILDLLNPATFSGTVKNFVGVVGVSVMAEEAAAAGPPSYAGLIAVLSLSLGLMNIVPIPPLDGGKIALEVIERIIGRPLSRAVTLGFSAVGAVMLFSLIGYIMYLDIVRFAM